MRPRLRPLRVTVVEEIDGRLVETTLTPPICDFCSDMRPEWDYPCETFDIPEIEFGSWEGWIACDPCSTFIEANDWEGVLERFTQAVGTPPEHIHQIWAGFRQHRTGPREPLPHGTTFGAGYEA